MEEGHESVVKKVVGENIPEDLTATINQFEQDMLRLGAGSQIPRVALIQQIYIGRLQERVIALESSLESVVKNLATPAGIAALKAKTQVEMQKPR